MRESRNTDTDLKISYKKCWKMEDGWKREEMLSLDKREREGKAGRKAGRN